MKIYSAQFKGTTTVATGSNVSLTGSFSGSIYGFGDTIQYSSSVSSDLLNLEIKSASVDISISNINSVTASNITRLSNLESKSASVDISISNINQYTGSNNTKWTTLTNVTSSLIAATGSYATTGSNTFFGTQTYSGSVYIANDLIVQGSSSIQYISASSVSIGTNIIQLNTANPSVRFAGLTIIDSGSIGGSGSFLYDSVHDEFVFVHRGNGSNITSSHFVLGPETYDNLGNELYLTCNIISKGTGKEHLVDSCIFDNGTTTCIKNNLIGTGTACFGSTTTIACNLILGNTGMCPSIIFSGSSVGGFTNGYVQWSGGNQTTPGMHINSPGTHVEVTTGFNERVTLSTGTGLQVFTNNGVGSYTSRMLLDRSGNACFSGIVCAPSAVFPTSVVVGATSLKSYSSLTTAGQIISISNIGTDAGQSFRLNNYYNAGTLTDRTISNGYAAAIGLDNSVGAMTFATSTTCATADNNVTVSERMRITNCGNIGINFPTPSFPLTRSGMTMKASTNDGVEFVMLSCADTGFLGGALVRNGADFGVINRTNGNLIFATNAQERLYITGTGIACFSCTVCAPTIKAGSSTTLTSGNITLGGYPTSICFGNGQTLNDNGNGGLTILSGAAIGLTAGSCIFMNCTVNFGKYQKHTDGYWYKIPFRVDKNSGSGTANTFCIVDINNMDVFNEFIVNIDYGARLQGISDQTTNISSRMYGVNRFNGGDPVVTESSIPIGGSGNINTHAPITVAVVNNCRVVVKVDFSSGPSFSSFVWGEIRVFSVENLNSRLSVTNANAL